MINSPNFLVLLLLNGDNNIYYCIILILSNVYIYTYTLNETRSICLTLIISIEGKGGEGKWLS